MGVGFPRGGWWLAAGLLSAELVEDLEGELAGFSEGFGGDVFHGVTVFMPVGHVHEGADEVEDREVGAIHEGDVVVGDGVWIGGDPFCEAEFLAGDEGVVFEVFMAIAADEEGEVIIPDDV